MSNTERREENLFSRKCLAEKIVTYQNLVNSKLQSKGK